MSTAALAGPPSRFAITFPRLLRSELIKFVTVRSTVWTLSIAVVIVIGFAMIGAFASKSQESLEAGDVPGAMAPIIGVYLAQLLYLALAVICIGSEYSTGMIRSTLSAAPERTPALLAKTAVVGAASFVVSFASVLVAFVAVQAILSTTTLGVDIGDPHVMRMLVGAALYISFLTMLSLSIGAIVRNTAAGISIIIALLIILPVFLPLIPWSPLEELVKYLPGAGESVMVTPGLVAHSAWTGFAILAAWTVVATVVASVLIRRRDA